jgi:hypothetical protein
MSMAPRREGAGGRGASIVPTAGGIERRWLGAMALAVARVGTSDAIGDFAAWGAVRACAMASDEPGDWWRTVGGAAGVLGTMRTGSGSTDSGGGWVGAVTAATAGSGRDLLEISGGGMDAVGTAGAAGCASSKDGGTIGGRCPIQIDTEAINAIVTIRAGIATHAARILAGARPMSRHGRNVSFSASFASRPLN